MSVSTNWKRPPTNPPLTSCNREKIEQKCFPKGGLIVEATICNTIKKVEQLKMFCSLCSHPTHSNKAPSHKEKDEQAGRSLLWLSAFRLLHIIQVPQHLTQIFYSNESSPLYTCTVQRLTRLPRLTMANSSSFWPEYLGSQGMTVLIGSPRLTKVHL